MPDQAEAPDKYRLLDTEFARSIDPDAGVDVTCFLTTDRVDEDNEVVLPGGVDLGRFSKNGPLMLCHDWVKKVSYYPLPVGQVLWVKARPQGLLGGIRFARGSEMGRECKALAEERVLRGVSVGFTALEQSPMTRAEAATRPDWQAAFDRTKGRINVIRRWKLLELSLTPIPCNEDALIETLRVKGLARPKWLTTRTSEAPMPEATETETAPEFKAKQAEVAALIDGLTGPAAVLEKGLAHARTKGIALGDLRTPVLSATVDRLGQCLNSYLWSLVYLDRDKAEDPAPKIEAAAAEFVEAMTLAFAAMEALRPDPKAIEATVLRSYSARMSGEAKALFGDPAAMLPAETKALDEADDDAEGEGEDAGPIRQGHFVKCVKGPHKGLTGKVKSVHRGEMVPDVEEDVHGTKADPGVRVNCYKTMGEGHVPTEHHVGCKMSQCEKVDDLKPPKKGRKGLDPATLPPLAGRSDDQVVAASLKTLPEQLRKELQRQEDRALGAV